MFKRLCMDSYAVHGLTTPLQFSIPSYQNPGGSAPEVLEMDQLKLSHCNSLSLSRLDLHLTPIF